MAPLIDSEFTVALTAKPGVSVVRLKLGAGLSWTLLSDIVETNSVLWLSGRKPTPGVGS